MNLTKPFLILLMSSLLVVGCGENKENELKPTPVSIPEELGFKPSPKRTQLTADQKEELKLAIGNRPQMIVPEVDLLFDTARFKSNEFTAREEKLRKNSLNSFNFLKDIQRNCQSTKPSEALAGNLKLQADGVQFKESKVGNDLILKSSAQLAGENCPITFDFHYDISGVITEVDAEKSTGSASGRIIQDGQAIMVSPKYVRLLQTRGLILSTKVDALNIRQSADNKILYNYKFKGSYLSLTQNIPLDGFSSMLLKTGKDGKKSREFLLTMEIATKKVNLLAEMHTKEVDNASVSRKFYFNGFETTETEFNEIFGNENPLVKAKKNLAKIN